MICQAFATKLYLPPMTSLDTRSMRPASKICLGIAKAEAVLPNFQPSAEIWCICPLVGGCERTPLGWTIYPTLLLGVQSRGVQLYS